MQFSDIFSKTPQKELTRTVGTGKNKKEIPVGTPEAIQSSGSLANVFNYARDKGMFESLGSSKELRQYTKAGISPNNFESTRDWQKQLAARQGTWDMWWNSMKQTVVSELAAGTLLGASNIVDFIGNAIFSNEKDDDYSNPFSEAIEKWQEEYKQNNPIWTDPDVDISNGGLLKGSWWASNAPSVISSLTLLLPTMGITKGISLAGKGLKYATGLNKITRPGQKFMQALVSGGKMTKYSDMNKVQKFFVNSNNLKTFESATNTIVSGSLMRTMENYQEARGTYNDVRTELLANARKMTDAEWQKVVNGLDKDFNDIDKNDREAVVNRIASKSADRTFAEDFANIGFDIWQMAMLKNPIKFTKNMRQTAAVARQNRISKMFAGKTAQEAEEAYKALPKIQRAKYYALDHTKEAAGIAWAEASEGVEEGVNYIAQQEGITYGKALWEGKGKDYKGTNGALQSLSENIQSYMRSPELYESAFWGVAGGIAFHGLGSAVNRGRNLATKAYDEYKNKPDETTGEQRKPLDWVSEFELSENKARVAGIRKRMDRFAALTKNLEIIESGRDPYSVDPQTGSAREVKDPTEQEILKQRAIDDWFYDVTTTEMENGTFNMLKAYLSDSKVQKAMRDAGVDISSEDFIRRMDEIADEYEDHVMAVSDAVDEMVTSKKKGHATDVSPEYIGIIAKDNLYHSRRAKQLGAELENYEDAANRELNLLGSRVDIADNYKRAARLQVLADLLGRAHADLRAVRDNQDYAESVAGMRETAALQKKIDEIHEMISDELKTETLSADAIAKSLYISRVAAKYVKDESSPTGYSIVNNTNEALDYATLDGAIVDGKYTPLGSTRSYKVDASNIDQVFGVLDPVAGKRSGGTYAVFAQQMQTAFNPTTGYNRIAPGLMQTYRTEAALQYMMLSHKAAINLTVDEVEKRINELHNYMKESRIEAIQSANDKLYEIVDKYDNDEVIDYLFYGGKGDNITKEDKASLDDLMRIYNFTSPNNYNLMDQLIFNIALHRKENRTQSAAGVTPSTAAPTTTPTPSPAPTAAPTPSTATPTPTPVPTPAPSPTTSPSLAPAPAPTGTTSSTATPVAAPTPAPAIPTPAPTPKALPIGEGNHSVEFSMDDKGNVTINKTSGTSPSARSAKVTVDSEGELTLEPDDDSYLLDGNLYGNPLRDLSEKDNIVDVIPPTLEPSYDEAGNLVYKVKEKGGLYTSTGLYLPTGLPSTPSTPSTPATPSTPTPATPAPATPSTEGTPAADVEAVLAAKQSQLEEIEHNIIADITTNSQGILNNTEAEIEAKLEQVRQELKEKYKDSPNNDEVNTIIDKHIDNRKTLYLRLKSSMDDSSIMFSSIGEVAIGINAGANGNTLADAVTTLLDNYILDRGIRNNVINIENLLRYINNLYNDTGISDLIGNFVYNWLASPKIPANKKYTIIGLNKTSQQILDDSKKERSTTEASVANLDVHNIYFESTLQEALDNGDETVVNAIRELQNGNELTYQKTDDGFRINIYSKGVHIGYLPIPQSTALGNGYTYRVGGFIINVFDDATSDVTDALNNILTNDNVNDFNNKVFRLAYDELTEEERENLINEIWEELNNNSELNQLRSLLTDDASATEVAIYLKNLYRYVNNSIGNTTQDTKTEIASTLQNWATTLYNSYFATTALATSAEPYTATVEKATNGEVVQLNTTDSEGKLIPPTYEEHKPASEAIVDAVYDIGIMTPKDGVNTIQTGTAIFEAQNQQEAGGVYLVIDNKDGAPQYVHCYSMRFGDPNANSEFQTICSQVRNGMTDIIKHIMEAKTLEEKAKYVKQYQDFMTTVFGKSGKGFNHNLFYGGYYEANKLGSDKAFRTSGKDNISSITITPTGTIMLSIAGTPVPIENMDSINKCLDAIFKNLAVNISRAFVNNELGSTTGYAIDNNSGFTIRIPKVENGEIKGTYDHTASNFNEAIKKFDLVKVNLSSENGSNFRLVAHNQRANAVVQVRFTKPETTPVEDSNAAPSTPTIDEDAAPVIEQLDKILEDSSNNPSGEDIAEVILSTMGLSDSVQKQGKKMLTKYGFLPTNIIFDETFNNDNENEAATNSETGVTKIGTVWKSLFGNASTRSRALRVLMHEAIHERLRSLGDEEYAKRMQQVKAIYDEFKEALAEDDPFKVFLNENIADENTRLEEFLIESLTNKTLNEKLNSIKAKGERVNKGNRDKTLLGKLLDFIKKIFGFDIKRGSLFEKEVNVLQDIFEGTTMGVNNRATTETKTTTATTEISTEHSTEEDIDDEYEEDYDVPGADLSDFELYSAIGEDIMRNNNGNVTFEIKSLNGFVDSLPQAIQPKFCADLLAGEIKIACR